MNSMIKVLYYLNTKNRTDERLIRAVNALAEVTDSDLSATHYYEMQLLIEKYLVLPAFAVNAEGLLTTPEAFFERLSLCFADLAKRVIAFNALSCC